MADPRTEKARTDPGYRAAYLERKRRERQKRQESYCYETLRKRKWRDANRAKDRAMHAGNKAVENALRVGTLVKPKACNRCHEAKKLEAHHHSYKPEHLLDVEWLCQACHSKHHRKKK